MHTTTLSENLEIAIPPALCDVLALTPGQAVDLAVKDGCLVISPLTAPTHIKKLRKRDPELDPYRGTNRPPVKMTAADGKLRKIKAANTQSLLRNIQSIPSPKAEPFKRWLAKPGYERLEEIENPELAPAHEGHLRAKGLLRGVDRKTPARHRPRNHSADASSRANSSSEKGRSICRSASHRSNSIRLVSANSTALPNDKNPRA
jgi:hypothetical protein